MTKDPKMAAPVTMAQLETAFAKLDEKLAKLPTRDELDHKLGLMGSALVEMIDRLAAAMDQRFKEVDRRFEKMDQRFKEVDQRSTTTEHRLMAAIASHANAILEAVASQVSVIDEKYRDLPPRVERLERMASKRTRR